MSFLLQKSLLDPGLVADMNHRQREQLISQARSSRLLASLTVALIDSGTLEKLPMEVRRHLQSGLQVHEKQRRDLTHDSELIRASLGSIGVRAIFLKGAAYNLARLPLGRGRLITDIDILVPAADIEKVEQTLIEAGWEGGQLDEYDDSYYRRWGHEIPPLTHRKRGTTLDIHHNILPPTAGPDVEAQLLLDECIEVRPGIFTLSWQDMVIHSATHLFHEGEFHHALRDLWDLDRMLRDFPDRDPRFWDNLAIRADRLQLSGSLFHCLSYTNQVFGTPLPEKILHDTGSKSRMLRKPMMDFLYLRVFRPDHPESKLPLTGLARFLLYVRAHYLRMPLYLLLPHLARKAWKRRSGENESPFTGRAAESQPDDD